MPQEDINRHKNQWESFIKRDYLLDGFNEHNKKIAKEFLKNFELGLNVPKSSKGKRTPATLCKLRWIVIFLNNHLKKDFEKITKKELHQLFKDMSDGKIKRENKTPYKDVGDFIKNTKTFWGWMLKTKKAQEDITEDLSRASYKKGKPAWVYLTHEQIKALIDNARGDYRALILFLYDAGLRPAEAYRLYVSDLEFKPDETLLTIPERRENGLKVSKTFERTIKLKHSSELIKNYISINKLKSTDLLFNIRQEAFNKYLREISKKLFGEKITKARGRTDQLKLYDIRHLSAIYWLDKYKTHKDLMYRMGWSKEDKVYYYSEFLGRRDKIDDEDMMTQEDKSKYEKEIDEMKIKQKNTLQEINELKQFILKKIELMNKTQKP